jgi:hypothetical protein
VGSSISGKGFMTSICEMFVKTPSVERGATLIAAVREGCEVDLLLSADS